MATHHQNGNLYFQPVQPWFSPVLTQEMEALHNTFLPLQMGQAFDLAYALLETYDLPLYQQAFCHWILATDARGIHGVRSRLYYANWAISMAVKGANSQRKRKGAVSLSLLEELVAGIEHDLKRLEVLEAIKKEKIKRRMQEKEGLNGGCETEETLTGGVSKCAIL